jgi:predicted small metal-binding protein
MPNPCSARLSGLLSFSIFLVGECGRFDVGSASRRAPGNCVIEALKGDSEHDVLRKAAEHERTDHHMESIPPEVLSKVKGAIHGEGEAQTQKAGSSH